ncbi:hypothetical protein GCM10017783_15670 [Deinococcus piscis]|uniref:Uncharacterized protein n=1 Tax=Deinococcus piscis TaxID=394230 RepID=A0ABQ3K574_9DEIO|nr:hypothetical protein GCM10017783_15670 [Deinococcus piscis]
MPESPQPSELSGTVSLLKVQPDGEKVKLEKVAWNLGEQQVNLALLSDKTDLSNTDTALAPVATGTVSAGGQLSLKLPQTVDAGLLSGNLWTDASGWDNMLGSNCTGNQPTVSDPAAQVGLGTLLVGTQPQGLLLAGPEPVFTYENLKFSGSAQAGTVMYADRATTVRSTVSCTYNTSDSDTSADDVRFTYSVNLNLKRGWNSVVVRGQGQGQQQSGTPPLFSANATLSLVSEKLPAAWMLPVLPQGAEGPGSALPLGLNTLR